MLSAVARQLPAAPAPWLGGQTDNPDPAFESICLLTDWLQMLPDGLMP